MKLTCPDCGWSGEVTRSDERCPTCGCWVNEEGLLEDMPEWLVNHPLGWPKYDCPL